MEQKSQNFQDCKPREIKKALKKMGNIIYYGGRMFFFYCCANRIEIFHRF